MNSNMLFDSSICNVSLELPVSGFRSIIYFLDFCGLFSHSLNNILIKLVILYFSLQILRGRKIINWDLFRPLIIIIRSRVLLPLQQWSQDPYIRVYKWRLKRYLVYPVRYFFGVQKSRLESSLKIVEKFLLISKIRANDTQAHNQCLQTCEPESYDLVFPPEVWIEIAKYGVDAITLMSVNKALLNIFGRLVYEELHGILVISSLEKLKASDQCFLRNGPDFEDSDLDGYGIYVRSKASKNSTHEAIDIAYNGETERYYLEHEIRRTKIDMKGRKVYPSANVSLDCAKIPTIVSSYSGLRCIITEIIRNRDSIMKKYINKFSIDVMVLSDFDEFTRDLNKVFGCRMDHLYYHEVKNEEAIMMTPLSSGYEEFSDQRINMRRNMAIDMANVRETECQHKIVPNRKAIKSMFETVYHKELFPVSFIFQSLFLSQVSNNRRSFDYRNSPKEYYQKDTHPYMSVYGRDFAWGMESRIDDTLREIKKRLGTRGFTDYLASTVRIKKRTFFAQDQLLKELHGLINELPSVSQTNRGDRKYSYVFHGMDYTNHQEFFHEEVGRYLSECLANRKWIIISNTSSDSSSKAESELEMLQSRIMKLR